MSVQALQDALAQAERAIAANVVDRLLACHVVGCTSPASPASAHHHHHRALTRRQSPLACRCRHTAP